MQKPDTDIERQVDELLVETLNKNGAFARQFVDAVSAQVGMPCPFARLTARRSPPRLGHGQTDLGISLTGASRIVLLIENKVVSPFMDRQAERYDNECRALLSARRVDHAFTVLISPEDYARRAAMAAEFHARVSYETIDRWFGGNPLIRRAIDRCRVGWVAEDVPTVSDNFAVYTNLARRDFPKLRVKTKPENKPTQSRTIYFDEKFSQLCGFGLPPIILNHQWQEGRAKLLLRGLGSKRGKLEPLMRRDLKGSGLSVDPNRTKSLGVMLKTPVIDNHRTHKEQVDQFTEGLRRVDQLRVWFNEHREMVTRWVEEAAS